MRPAAATRTHSGPPSLRGLPVVLLALLFLFALPARAQSPDPLPHLTVHVPGSEGGGFDRAAQSMRAALLSEGLAREVQLVHSPGAGGLIGLSEFLRSETGNPHAVFVAGRSTVGATDFNRSSVSLRDAVPVAGMLGNAIAVAVPEASPLRSLEALLTAFRDDPDAIAWVGGSAGSQDELFLLELADALGVDRRAIDYRPVPGGGGAVVGLGLSGEADVILSSPEELAQPLRDGTLRLLATSHQVSGLNSPVAADVGIREISPDWRAVFAAPGLDASELDQLSSTFKALAGSSAWQEELSRNGWTDLYLSPTELGAFLDTESARIRSLRAPTALDARPLNPDLARVVGRPYRWLPPALALIALLLAAVVVQRWAARRRTQRLERNLATLKTEMDRRLLGAREHIEREFGQWRLTASEREVGWLLLKGLSFREVSEARGTSERTSRQQARAVYAKSGLGSRSDLSAYFFEDFVFGGEDAPAL